MRILHINTNDHGGAAIAAIRLHNSLLAQGVDSSMLFLNKINKDLPSTFAYNDHEKNNHGFILRNLIRLKSKLILKMTHRFRNAQKLQDRVNYQQMFSFNPSDFDITTQTAYQDADIIHLHWIAGFVDYNFFKKNYKPIIWTLHDMNPFTGGCHYSNQCEKYKTECRECPQLLGTINTNNSLTDQYYKNHFLSKISPVITAPSAWLTNCSSQSTLFKKFQNIHIPYSLDISIFKPLNKLFCRAALNLPLDKNILLFVSDNIEAKRKGFDLLLKALTQLNQIDIHVCAIGNGNDKVQSKNELTFLGRISDERLMSIAYSAADVFVLPSREDNLPNVMLESLACGTPVIAFPVGGMLDVIKTGFNGILAQDLTSNSLAHALNDFFEGKYTFDNNIISNNARQNFSPFIQADRYIMLYKNMLDSNKNEV